MNRDVPLAVGETYHIYNRGAHKQNVFADDSDYERFLLLLLLANRSTPLLLRDLFLKYRGRTSAEIFENESGTKDLVEVLAYTLMPNHFHLILRQKAEYGITHFMKRISVAYSMYYNLKRAHSGVIFQGRFKSQHVDTDPYFRYLFSYVHLNPLELFSAEWKKKGLPDEVGAKKFLEQYRYSSFADYVGKERAERAILSLEMIPTFLTTQNDFEELLRWQKESDLIAEVAPL